MSGKLLTISIPTWNRSSLLKSMLQEISGDIEKSGMQDKVSVLVSNNNSDDDTENVVREFQNQFSFITYNRNQTNIGAKSNVLKSMHLAESDYVLFMGDDDRMSQGAIIKILSLLEEHRDGGVFIDTSLSKRKINETKSVTLDELLKDYYWYIGNAGLFIIRTQFVKEFLDKYGYDFFNECWPQTQIMILSLSSHREAKCYITDIGIHAEGVHGEVMLYNSFYLWRTCYYELTLSIDSLADKIQQSNVASAKEYLKGSLGQQLFNILQCGLFVDTSAERLKTRKHIASHLGLFGFREKIFLCVIIFALSMPVLLSRPLANLFIRVLKGNSGLEKKNNFVSKELQKRNVKNNAGSVRTLEFEKK